MKALNHYTNTDKLKLLHGLFPDEMTSLLDHIAAVCKDFQEHKQEYKESWASGLMPFDYWLSLSEETDGLIKKYRTDMIRNSRVFSDQLSFSYAVLFVNDRIIKYADSISFNAKFKLAVNLLFK